MIYFHKWRPVADEILLSGNDICSPRGITNQILHCFFLQTLSTMFVLTELWGTKVLWKLFLLFFFSVLASHGQTTTCRQQVLGQKNGTILFLWVTEWWSSANNFIQHRKWKENKSSSERWCFWNDFISETLREMTWSTCGSEGRGKLNIEHVQCIVCWSRKQPRLSRGNFQCPYFPSTHLPCNGSVIYNNTQWELCEGPGHFYTLHPLAAQRRDFYRPLYVGEAGEYRWQEQLPGMTIITVWGGQRTKEAPPQREIIMRFIILPHFPDHQALD